MRYKTLVEWGYIIERREIVCVSEMKHVERRHFYLRELVEDHVIRVPFVATVDNIADFFTKPLKSKDFFRMRDVIMNVPARSRENSAGRSAIARASPRVCLDAEAVATVAVRSARRHRNSVRAVVPSG